MTTKAMTAAEYRALVKAKRDVLPTELVTLPTGMVIEMRRPDLKAYIVTGRYPQTLVSEGLKVLKEKGIAPSDPNAAAALSANLDSKEFGNALVFMREMVREACVKPRLVMGAQGDDELDPSEVDIDDFNFMVEWCLNYKGVKNAEGVATFRKGRRKSAGNKPNGKKLRKQTVRPVGHHV